MSKGYKRIAVLTLLMAVVTVLGFAGTVSAEATEHEMVIMSTTDEHQYMMPYDYMGDEVVETRGLSKIHTLVEEYRAENDNTLLISTGDVIQGSLVGDMEAEVDPIPYNGHQTIIDVFNAMGYESVTVGNHDVTDYGLEFFERARSASEFPWVSANIMMADDQDQPMVDPYTIIEKEINGEMISIGVIGFVPPQIMQWGKRHLEGEVITKDIVEQAEKYLPELEEKTDIIIAAAHTGISSEPVDSFEARENAAYYLAQFDEIDAMTLGHQHNYFPDDYEDLDGVNVEKGTLFGTPTVMPGSWGSSLGVIRLNLRHEDGQWEVTDGRSDVRKVQEDTPSSKMVEDIANDIHEKTVEYVRTPIGETERRINSFFARVTDSSITQIVNEAQLWYAEQELDADVPVLSAAAPFIAGREGPDYFTHVEGDINIGDVTDMYIYPNTVYVMRLNGQQVIDWLERSAENFNQIDPNSSETQHLVNYEMPAYNYDVIEGIEYAFDVTQPEGERVAEATYNGEPLTEDMEFLVITNNYRGSGGGEFPHMTEENLELATTDINRQQIIRYIEEKGTVNPVPTDNWRIRPVDVEGQVIYRSSPEGADYLDELNLSNIEYLETDEDGWGIYEIDLSN